MKEQRITYINWLEDEIEWLLCSKQWEDAQDFIRERDRLIRLGNVTEREV